MTRGLRKPKHCMTQYQKALDELAKKVSEISNKQALIGFDGFIEKIENHEETRGTGPAIAEGLLACGQKVKYIGTLGTPTINPLFKDFAKKTTAVSLAEPGELEKITFEEILIKMGEGIFIDAIFRSDLIGFVNWEKTPNMTSILIHIIEKILPSYGPHEGMIFFFDLGNVSKRSEGDLRAILSTIKRFQNYGDVLMSFDIQNAHLVYKSLGHNINSITKENVKKIASELCQELKITMIAIHNEAFAACATHRDHFFAPNPWLNKTIIETNYFSIGLITAFLLRLAPPSCLILAIAFSTYYLENKKIPTLSEITSFISITN